MSNTFNALGLPSQLTEALSRRGIDTPFPVQTATIPDVLAGRDVSGKAPTGSGKTLAFGLPLLAKVDQAKAKRPRGLILAPTRELAEQIYRELGPLSKAVGRSVAAVYGGVSYGPQKNALRKGVDILVATPGRLEDLIEQGSISLDQVDRVVIDEADRMADMGFMPAVRRILDQTSRIRQTLLFSATLDGDVAQLSRAYQTNPVRHEAEAIEPETVDATHHFWHVDRTERVQHTAEIISKTGKTIVFTRTRRGADRLAKQLSRHDVDAVAMHGGLSQGQRNRSLKQFATGKASALVATDVAARGIHVDDVATVVHYDPAGDHKDYVHRSGRTGRAGASGTVVSLVLGDQKRSVLRMMRQLKMKAHLGEPKYSHLKNEPKRPSRPNRRPAPHQRPVERTQPVEAGSTRIYVGNLPWSTTSDDLDRMFSRHGHVTRSEIATRRGRSKGFGIVEMPDMAAARAIESFQGATLSGRTLKVRKSDPTRTR